MILETRKSLWVALFVLALLCAAAAAWLFPKALPMLQLEVSMSRDQALVAAQRLQSEHFAELTTGQAVARFDHDGDLQNYIELEGGGVEVYAALLGQRYVAPYLWTVRLFSEAQEGELSVHFTPEGHPYGFVRKVAEKAAGAALAVEAARTLAQAGARSHLGDALWADYAALSASQITRPGGRIDHSFVYEHQTERRAEVRFRIRLVVAGDRLVEVTPYAFVPQGFSQRFDQLRAGNETIASVASIAMFGVFGLGGLLGGWLWLARRGGLEWRGALVGGGVVGVLGAASVVSNLPMAWFGYATTDSASTFLLRHGAMALATAVGATLMLGLLFAVAEGLSRRAFAGHPRLFEFWSVAAGASPQAWGRTAGGYAWMAIELLLVVGFYLLARTQFGWWVPAESLSDPNILSAWRPALGPIADALQAGTMEEALFRAVPLAAAALIGTHLGWKRSAIAVALVLQALVFAGAHANYPGLPSYSRVVELFLPALVWGLIFLRYGLVPCIVMHFTFDLALMSLPLFVASDSRLWLDRVLVIAAGLVPLVMVARARFKQGHFAALPTALRNGHSVDRAPVVASGDAIGDVIGAPAPLRFSAQTDGLEPTEHVVWLRPIPLLVAATLGVVALIFWQASPTPTHTAAFTVDHDGAIARAQAALLQRGVRLEGQWKPLAHVLPIADGNTMAVRFVWREAGAQVLARLLNGGKLSPQQWQVMFKHVDGPVEERSEEWEVDISGQGDVLRIFHHLPEGRPGAKLDRDQAMALARGYIDSHSLLTNRPWVLASVQEIERPARRDWIIRWDDKQALDVKGGTARLAVAVRGDEVNTWQGVFVPDAWTRAQQEHESAKTPFKMGMAVAGGALVLLMLGTALRHVVRGTLRWRLGLAWAALVFVPLLARYLLTIDRKALAFNVAQPWDAQLATAVAMAAIGFMVVSALMGMLAMRVARDTRAGNGAVANDMLRGLGLALVLKGVQVSVEHFLPANQPRIAGVGAWDSLHPLLATLSAVPTGVCIAVGVVALTLGAVDFCRTRGNTVLLWALFAVLVVGGVLAAETVAEGVAGGLPTVLMALALWLLVRRGAVGTAIAMLSLFSVVDVPQALAIAHADAAVHAMVMVGLTTALTWWALRYGRSLGAANKPL